MNTAEHAEFRLLELMTPDTHKFAIQVDFPDLEPELQLALERLQIREWVRLIDVAPVAAAGGRVCRVFMVTDAGLRWYFGVHLLIDKDKDDDGIHYRGTEHPNWKGD